MERMAKVIGGLAVVLVVFLLVIRAGRPARREAVPAPPEQEIKFTEVPGEVAEGLFEDEEKLEERMPAEGEVFASEELPGAQEDAEPAPLSHEVKWRETIGHIANRYDTTVSAICEANGIKDPHRIMPGQTLLIPRKAPRTPMSAQILACGKLSSFVTSTIQAGSPVVQIRPGNPMSGGNRVFCVTSLKAA